MLAYGIVDTLSERARMGIKDPSLWFGRYSTMYYAEGSVTSMLNTPLQVWRSRTSLRSYVALDVFCECNSGPRWLLAKDA